MTARGTRSGCSSRAAARSRSARPSPRPPRPTSTGAPPEGAAWLPARTRPLASRLAGMPAVAVDAPAAAPLVALGVLAPEDLPLVLVPAAPRALDGWRFV